MMTTLAGTPGKVMARRSDAPGAAAAAAMLLLFDIDGTLVDTGGAGLRALRAAMLDEFGLHERAAEFPPLDLAGSTDGGVARLLFSHFTVPLNPETIERFYTRYHQHLRHELHTWGRKNGRLLPGVSRLLHRLTHHPDRSDALALGLLTGNIARGAHTKIASYGLGDLFAFGAYGDDHHDRDALGPVAIARAERHTGRRFSTGEVFIIGDTPKDIRCARACGAWAVAVATGRFSVAELEEHRPDLLFHDFEDAEHFVAEVERLAGTRLRPCQT